MQPEPGSVSVDGFDSVRDAEAVRRRLGVLPDARGVYKRLTARENIAYFGRLHQMPEEEIAARIAILSKALDMDDFLDRPTEGFSQGQRTKTAIARAPREFLRGLRAEGRCVIFSSHIMQEVAALCDRIVVIAKGHVVAQGSADELRAQTGEDNLEDAFVKAIGSDEGLHA